MRKPKTQNPKAKNQKRQSTDVFTQTLKGFSFSAKNAERARLGKSFIKDFSTVILPNKASEYRSLHTNATPFSDKIQHVQD